MDEILPQARRSSRIGRHGTPRGRVVRPRSTPHALRPLGAHGKHPPVRQLRAIPAGHFIGRWAGFATAKPPDKMTCSDAQPGFQFVQRSGERPEEYRFGACLSTTDRVEVDALTLIKTAARASGRPLKCCGTELRKPVDPMKSDDRLARRSSRR